jgi:VIT1/CCC1 family predicted Fe2+/Mn2+ transporter
MIMLSAPLTLAQSLPQGGSVPLGVALMAGLLLWIMGARVIKPVFFLFGLAIGGFVGTTLMPLIGFPSFDVGGITISPSVVGLVCGGIIGALCALAMFRLVIAMTSACAFAVAGVVGAMIFLHYNPTTLDGDPSETEAALVESGEDAVNGLTNSLSEDITREAAERSVDMLDQNGNILDEDTKQQLLDAAERSRQFLSDLGSAISQELDQRPTRDKMIGFSAGFAGFAFGLLIGVVLPKRTTALVTSLFGSAVCMASTSALLTASNGQRPEYLNQSATVLAIVWVLLTGIGLMIQLGFITRKTNNTRTSDGDDDD